MSVQKKMGNVIIDDSNLTAERTYKGPNWDAYLADSVAVTEAYGSKPALWFQKTSSQNVSFSAPSGAIGTGDFCIFAVVRYPVGALASSVSPNNYDFIFSVGDNTSYNMLAMRDDTGQAYWYAGGGTSVTGGPAINDGRMHAIAAVRRSGVLELYVDGRLVTSAANVTSYIAFDATTCFIGYSPGTRNAERTLWRAAFLNYAPTAQTIARLSAGARFDYSDLQGSMTSLIVNSTFESDTVGAAPSNWSVNGGTVTVSSTQAHSGTKSCKVIGTTGLAGIFQTSTLSVGKRYLVTAWIYGTLGETYSVAGVTYTLTTSNAWEKATFVITATSVNLTIINALNGYTGTFYIDDISCVQLGALLDYEPEGLTANLWHDESGNGLDGTVVGAQIFNTPHLLNTDYGPSAVLQDVQDNTFSSSKYYLAASDYIEHSTPEPSLAIGDSDATFIITAKIPAARSTTLMILQNGTQYLLFRTTTGQLHISESDGASTSSLLGTYVPSSGGVATYAVTRYSTNKYRGYVNGVPGPEMTKTRKAPSGNLPWKVGNSSSDSYNGEVSRALFFNYALSEDKIRRYSAGAKLDYDDVGGSMVEKVTNGTFTGNATGWNLSLGFAYNSNNIRATGTQTNANCSQVVQFVRGKRYRLKYNVVTNENLVPITMSGVPFTGNAPTVANQPLDPTVGAHILEFVADFNTGTGNTFQIFAGTADVATNLGSTTGVTLDDISIVQLGACVDLEPENIADSTWVDASPNALHGAVSGALANRFVPQYSSRNYIINGALDFWQRNTSGTPNSQPGDYVAADRFRLYSFTSNVGNGSGTFSQLASPGLTSSLYGLTCTSNHVDLSQFSVSQYIESNNCLPLIGKICTVSFKAKRASTTIGAGKLLTINVWRLNSKDTAITNFSDPSVSGATLVSQKIVSSDLASISNTTWTEFSSQVAIPSTANNGLCIEIRVGIVAATGIATSTGAIIHLGEIQMNEGPVAAPFERAGGTIGGELALCHRYYEKSYPLANPPGTGSVGGYFHFNGGTTSSTLKAYAQTFRINKRTIPTLALYDYAGNGGTGASKRMSTVGTTGTVTNNITPTNTNVYETALEANYTTTEPGILAHWVADAEI